VHDQLIRDPIIIVGTPRSGTSSLFAALACHSDLWSIYSESGWLLDGPYHPKYRGWDSHVLTDLDLDPKARPELERQFFEAVGNLERLPLGRHIPIAGRGKPWLTPFIAKLTRPLKKPPVRIVEKNIPNILRTRFMRALFPTARFLHLTRNPLDNLTAMYRGWMNPYRYNDFPLPPGFKVVGHEGGSWAFLLPPGWRSMNGKTLAEVCAFQWGSCHRRCLDDLAGTDPSRYLRIHFEELVMKPAETLSLIASWAQLDPRQYSRFISGLPRINMTKNAPRVDVKVEEIRAVLPLVEDVAGDLGYSVLG